MMKAVSHDKGETWEGVYNTPMCGGHRPTSGFLNECSVMVTYRFHYKHPEGMANMFGAFLSADTLTKNVRSEQDARIFPIDYDRNADPDSGYTGWVQFDDGEIYVVNYIAEMAAHAKMQAVWLFRQYRHITTSLTLTKCIHIILKLHQSPTFRSSSMLRLQFIHRRLRCSKSFQKSKMLKA